ncbi:MAG: DNA repair protein RadC [Vicinamibacteria bacterium]|nr:DNA repair protein RadC [Vicinamibacteria bacterium]
MEESVLRPPSRSVRAMTPEERPRERLARHGASALANSELMAVLLGAGSRRQSVLDLAEVLVNPGLRELAGASIDDLERHHGLGRAKALRLLAALELGARLASEGARSSTSFREPGDVARHLLPRYAARTVENFGLLALDVRHRLRREAVVSVGGFCASVVHPREVFAIALAARAVSLILFHNHPSGDPEPSSDDVALTRRLVAAGAILGIEVLDHMILGAGRFVSLKQRGLL